MSGEEFRRDPNDVPVIGGWDPDTGEPVMVPVETISKALKVFNIVWDPVAMQPAMMQQPTIHADDLHVSMGDLEKTTSNSYWRKTLYEYHATKDLVIYKGYHTQYNITDSDPNHFIIKYSYDGSDRVHIKQMAVGAWTNRNALGW